MRIFIISFLALLLFPGISFAADDACKGVPLDDREYYRIHAEQGDMMAQLKLGQIYLLRRTPEYNEKAVELFRKAAEQGHVLAYIELARTYDNDNGASVPQDFSEAYFWYSLANPHRQQTSLKIVATKLSEVQKDVLNERVEKWRSAHKDVSPLHWSDVRKKAPPNAFLNVDGILCGGESNGCKMVDSCGDMAVVNCVARMWAQDLFFVSKTTKETLNLCSATSKYPGKFCKNGPLNGWKCEWPKNIPTHRYPLFSDACKKLPKHVGDDAAQKEWESFCNQSPSYEIAATCGDLLFLETPIFTEDYPSYFADMRRQELLVCGYWGGGTSCPPHQDWGCEWPPYFPDPPFWNPFRHSK